MKMKRSNVHYIDQKLRRKKQSRNRKFKNNDSISIMTYCQCCKKQTTKKNKINNFYLCDKCFSLNYLNINEENLNSNMPKYINWEDDLDYLYQNFWLNGDI
ncbi:gp230 [Bacillus phage G]|uniref:Gp230 n=1 Tax=Bacillus phage G TaxID=2884420 RepID=G3M9X1_9CAUD|nr:gp230 [Bacillus phage G]AEO93489.1 gp230 [Bacillus phage G]